MNVSWASIIIRVIVLVVNIALISELIKMKKESNDLPKEVRLKTNILICAELIFGVIVFLSIFV